MIVLDTDHISVLGDPSPVGLRLLTRLEDAQEAVVTTAVSVEENLNGWLQYIHQAKTPDQLIRGYDRLLSRVEFLSSWSVLSWDLRASQCYSDLRSSGVRIGTHDLRIASIVLAQDATLLTRNIKDFEQVPGLRIANWLDDF